MKAWSTDQAFLFLTVLHSFPAQFTKDVKANVRIALLFSYQNPIEFNILHGHSRPRWNSTTIYSGIF
jgi:hypothetical protein